MTTTPTTTRGTTTITDHGNGTGTMEITRDGKTVAVLPVVWAPGVRYDGAGAWVTIPA